MSFVLYLLFLCTASLQAQETASPTLNQRLQAHIHPQPDQKNLIGYIKIEGSSGISEATWLYVKKSLEYYQNVKPIFIILELNTPGGEVFAAQKISDALKNFDTQFEIPVIAYINNWAISAGAMLAYSCRFIVVAKDASMGAAEPVLATQTGEMKEASEKVNSAIRTDFANRAAFFDRNPFIAEGMVDKDLILVMRDNKIIKLDSEAQIRTGSADPDILIKAKGKLLTLSSEQLMRYGVADLLIPPSKLTLISPEEITAGTWPASKMALFQYPFFAKISNATVESYKMDWKTGLFVFLANPYVSSILVLGLMLGIYLEMSSPGMGLPGAIAVICLFFIALSSLSLEIAGWLELILLLSGLLIIAVDLFVLPTFGLIGIFGLILFIAGLLGMLLPGIGSIDFDFNTQTLNAAGNAFVERLAWISATFVVGVFLIILLSRFITPKFALWRRFVLYGNEQDSSDGYVALRFDQTAIGKTGIVLTDLKPSGYILVEGKKHSALSENGYITKGSQVLILRGTEENLVVKSADREKSEHRE